MEETKVESPFVEIDLRKILNVIQKWKFLIAGITVAAVVTSALLSFFVLPAVYEARVDLLTAKEDPQYAQMKETGIQEIVDIASRLPEMTLNSYMKELKNPLLMRKVIDSMKLDPKIYSPTSLAGIIKVSTIKDSNLIELTVSHNDPKMASDIANKVAEEFIAFINANNQAQMEKSVKFLTDQSAVEEKNLATATENLKKFQAEPRGVAVLEHEMKSKTENLNGYQKQRTDINIELEQVKAGAAQATLRLSKTPQLITIMKDIPDDGTTEPVKTEELNPAYVTLSETLEAKLVAISEKEAQFKSLETTITGLTDDVKKLQAELTSKQLQQNRLQNEVNRIQANIDLLAQKTTETRIARSINLGAANLTVVAPAIVPDNPVKPKKVLNMAIAFILGLMISLALAVGIEYFDNTIKSARDIEEYLELPVLAQIPLNPQAQAK